MVIKVDISHTKSFVNQNLTNVKTATDVAKLLKISPAKLCRTFLRSEDISLNKYIFTRKVFLMQEYALIEPNTRCCEVCYYAGMREDSGARIFKKITKMTVKEFRKAMRDENIKHIFFQKRQMELTK